MFITGCRNMNYHISIELRLICLGGGHSIGIAGKCGMLVTCTEPSLNNFELGKMVLSCTVSNQSSIRVGMDRSNLGRLCSGNHGVKHKNFCEVNKFQSKTPISNLSGNSNNNNNRYSRISTDFLNE
jgi:hypothetical protein